MIKVDINAKINLSLNIISKEGNGYHSLDMVMASVTLADAITISLRKDKEVNTAFSMDLPAEARIPEERNTAHKAAVALAEAFGLPGADILIEKRIPLSSGFGGSSADAAGVLLGLCAIYGIEAGGGRVQEIALSLGADVPYLMEGGFARARGYGEKIERLTGIGKYHAVLAKGHLQVSTAESYKAFDSIYPSGFFSPADNDALIAALRGRDFRAIAANSGNALFLPSVRLDPGIAGTLEALEKAGAAVALMSGSGSGCFGLFESAELAEAAAKSLRERGFEFAESVEVF